MSKTIKWLLVCVCVVLVLGLVAWKMGLFDSLYSPGQSASVSNSVTSSTQTPTTTSADAGLMQDTAAVDAQMQASVAAINALGQTLSTTTVASAGAQIQTTLALMSKLGVKLEVRISTQAVASRASLQPVLNDLNRNILNAGSQASVAVKNSAMKTATTATLQQAKIQLQTAQGYAQTARADVQSIWQQVKTN